ncbi:unannotated protein [freshwater metagenome]|uniref:Unannotated protein n=1 Tax=freshwater metagenome TaxID=449393 RepID=A0A6J7D0B6_9ZZZZ|nr:serine hydrolase [Actinomycetota bacterium]
MNPDSNTATDRQHAVAIGLLPIMRIVGQPLRWTVDERLAHYVCPGVAIAAMRSGRIDWAAGYGRRVVNGAAACDADTVFMVASCSKPVAAMVVLQQVERGLLDLDADVNTYLRRWQVPSNEFSTATPVTLRHILSHSAGLTVNGFGVVPRDGRPVATELDLLEGRPPSDQPPVIVDKHYDGTDRYSGGGYVIAQLVVEDVLQRSFDSVADEMIFTPLGMSRTTYTQPLPGRLHDNVASGHGDDGREQAGGWMISSEKAAGGLFSTARDYAAFLLACRAAYHGEAGAILGRSLAVQMMTRHDKGVFGLGIRVLGDGPSRYINHGGSNDGYQSETNCFLDSGDGGVVLTNATSGLFLWKEVLNGMADVYDWPDYMPEPKVLRTMSAVEMSNLAGSYRIVSGIELPVINVWADNGRLYSEIPGLRFGVQETFCDADGVLFNQAGPYETTVTFGDDGRATELRVFEGANQIMRAVRTD